MLGYLFRDSINKYGHTVPKGKVWPYSLLLIQFFTQPLVLSARRLNCCSISSRKAAGTLRRILPPNWNSQPQNIGLIWTLTFAAYLSPSRNCNVSGQKEKAGQNADGNAPTRSQIPCPWNRMIRSSLSHGTRLVVRHMELPGKKWNKKHRQNL